MLKIEVSTDVKRCKTANGEFVEQVAFVHQPGHRYPLEVVVPVPRGAEPYPEGTYTLSPESFYLDVQYGRPRLAFRPVLVATVARPAVQPAKAAG
jgi:Helix-destabilising protein.